MSENPYPWTQAQAWAGGKISILFFVFCGRKDDRERVSMNEEMQIADWCRGVGGRVRCAVLSQIQLMPQWGWSSNDMGLVRLGTRVNRKWGVPREDQQRAKTERERLLKEISSDSRVKFKCHRETAHINADKKKDASGLEGRWFVRRCRYVCDAGHYKTPGTIRGSSFHFMSLGTFLL